MAVPAGGEIAIYAARAKTTQVRYVLGFTERQWTAIFSETFGADLSHSNWRTTQWGGSSISVSGGRGLIRAYHGPPREEIITREHAFPTDPTKAFKVTIVVSFPVADPIYSQFLCVGGIEGLFGLESMPLMVIQAGSADDGDTAGSIVSQSMGSVVEELAYTSADQTFVVEWDPDAAGGTGSEKLTIRRAGSIIAESSDDGFAQAPRYVQCGYVRGVAVDYSDTTEPIFEGLGTPTVPVTTMSLDSVTIEEDGNGYETATYPAWTSANAGGTIDTAAEGERFALDSVTWALIPQRMVKSASGWGASRDGAPSPSLTISVGRADSADLTADRWIGRTLLIDTRVGNDAGSFTAWKRTGVYTVESVDEDDNGIRLSLVDRPTGRLDTPIARSYIGADADSDALGEIEATNIGFALGEIVTDMIDVADAHAGGLIPSTDRLVNMPAIFPSMLDTGGDSLLGVVTGICDRLVQQMWTRCRTTGTGKYGCHMINVWDFGLGTAGWTFYGRGGAANSTVAAPGIKLMRNARGPSQVFYRNNNPLVLGEIRTLANVPLAGTFPSGAYPAVGRELDDSMALVVTAQTETTAHGNGAFSPLEPFPSDDEDAIDRFGGPAFLRYWMESLRRRRVSFTVYGHDWMEPGDEIAIDDPDGRGLTTAETWVIDSVSYSIDSDGALKADIEATTASLEKAITSTI